MAIMNMGKWAYKTHRHKEKDEIYIVVEGSCIFTEYDSKGNLVNSNILRAGGVALAVANSYHKLKPLTDKFLFIEVSNGPFIKTDIYLKQWD